MAEALSGHPSADKLRLDFYDRDRLANWVDLYPGVAAWVRARIGRPLAGWQPLGDWAGTRVGGEGKFISDDSACLLDARASSDSIHFRAFLRGREQAVTVYIFELSSAAVPTEAQSVTVT